MQVLACGLIQDRECQGAFSLFLGHAACHGLGEGELSGLLIVVPQVDLFFTARCELFASGRDSGILRDEPFDRGVRLCDRIGTNVDIIKHNSKQETVLGIPSY